jgi:pimeloyl-ACP methyl ester carboxylesterase
MTNFASSSGITIEFDTFGSADASPLLLVMGYTAQMTGWAVGFCQRLADAGHFVIRFDNRDCGLSTKFDGVNVDLGKIMLAAMMNQPESIHAEVPYTLSDMANDGWDLLDHLGIERAHIVGASMGGMIVQTMATEHPERTLSLTSIMSMTGEVEYGQSAPEAQLALMTPSPTEREAYIEASVTTWTVWMSKRYRDVDGIKQRAAESYDRSFYPEGAPRQMGAIVASGSRADALRALKIPTLVIHGLDDTLITPTGGQRTAELVPGARLELIEDMGHDLPEELWPTITSHILSHTKA